MHSSLLVGYSQLLVVGHSAALGLFVNRIILQWGGLVRIWTIQMRSGCALRRAATAAKVWCGAKNLGDVRIFLETFWKRLLF